MARAKKAKQEQEIAPGLSRTCHICERTLQLHVWYGRNDEPKKRKKGATRRVYACPECIFGLTDDERKDYYRERV